MASNQKTMIRSAAVLTVVAVIGAEWAWLVLGGRDNGPFAIGAMAVSLILVPALLALTAVGLGLVLIVWTTPSGGRRAAIVWAGGETLLGGFFLYLALTNTDPYMADFKAGAPLAAAVAWFGAAGLALLWRLHSAPAGSIH